MRPMRASGTSQESGTNRHVFEDFYRDHVGEVFSYAAARVGRDEAEDITAEVFHAAARRLGTDDAVLTAGWLITVARNKVIDHWRRRERRERKLHLLIPTEPETDPAEFVVSETDRDLVKATLVRLSTRHRLLLILHYVDGLPARRLAEQAEMSVTATESALARARRAFRSEYEKQEHKRERP